jgi:predicted nucleotidyltransferase
MKREDVISRLLAHEDELRRLGVLNLFLFGSTVRDDARDESDIDLFFDYQEGQFGLFQLMDIMDRTTEMLGRKADVMTRDSIHKMLKDQVVASAVQVF